MSREERDPQDRAADTPRRATDRLDGGRASSGDVYDPNWRGAVRASGRQARPVRAIPTSTQDFVLWLQFGGWRFVLATAAIVAIIALLIVLTSRPPDALAPLDEGGLPASDNAVIVNTPLPTVTPAPALPTAIPVQTGARFRVTGTGAEGLFLRPEPSTANPPIKTLPEGSEVTIIGEDRVQPDRVWKNIRDDQGAEGWVASDFLKPVAP